jgi:tetratricopeptide (TPR) repeat protein
MESPRTADQSDPVTPVEAWERSANKLRVLMVISSPIDEPERLSPRRELEAIHLQLNYTRVSAALIRLNPPTWRYLGTTLHARHFDVVHFIGHARPNEIQLEREDGTADWVSSADLAQLFVDAGVRLAVLNNCSSEPLGDALVLANVPAVIATSKPLHSDVATLISATLYSEIANGGSLRAAVDMIERTIAREARESTDVLVTALGPGAEEPLFPERLPSGEPEFFMCNAPNSNLPLQLRDSFLDRVDKLLEIYRLFDTAKIPFIGIIGLPGAGKSTVALGVAWQYDWRFWKGIAYGSLRRMRPFSIAALLSRLSWGLDGLSATAQRDVALHELSRGPALIILDDLEDATPEEAQEIVELLASWNTSLGGKALLVMRTRRPEFDSLIQANWIEIGEFPQSAGQELLVEGLGGIDAVSALAGKNLSRLPALCHNHPNLIKLTAGALQRGIPVERIAQQLQEGAGGPMETIFEILALSIGQLEKEVPMTGLFLDSWPVFADAATDEGWRFVVVGTAGSDHPTRHLQDMALELLQRATILQRQSIDGEEFCHVHSLISEYLSGRRWSHLSETKKRDYEERHLRYYCLSIASRGSEFPAVLEWANLLRALERASERGDWPGTAELTELLAGNSDSVLMRKSLWTYAKQVLPFGLRASRELDDANLRARFLYCLGLAHYRTAEYHEAQRSFEEGLLAAQDGGDLEVTADLGLQLGRVAYRLVNYDTAKGQFEAVRSYSMTQDDQKRLASALHELGRLSYRQGDLAEARSSLDEALAERQSLEDLEGTAQTLHEIGRVLHKVGIDTNHRASLDEAQQKYEESLSLRRKVGDVVGQVATIHQLGLLSFDRGDYDQARQHYDSCVTLCEGLGDRFWTAHNQFRYARLLWQLDEKESALEMARESQRLAAALGISLAEDVAKWLQSLSEPQASRGEGSMSDGPA